MIKKIFKNLNVAICLIVTSVLNIFDGFSTLYWINHGLAEEANPLMKQALELGSWEFILIKVGIVTLSCLLLYRFREFLSAQIATFLVLICYSALAAYHVAAYIHFSNVL